MEHKLTFYVIISSFILALLTSLVVVFYTNFFNAFGILAGTSWGCANFYFLKKLCQEWLQIKARNPLKLYSIIGIKFPLLYLIGFGFLHYFPIVYSTIGFSLIFVAIFLKGLIILIFPKRWAVYE